jgi:hypothetical protein
MTIWEKTLVNLQKGHTRLMSFAATFSERARAEVNIMRLKIHIDGVRRKISDQQQFIGRKLLKMKEDDRLPRTWDLFFQLDDIASAVEKIERYQKDEEILLDDLQHEAEVLKPAPAGQEERSA